MNDIPTGWLSLIMAAVTALLAGVGYVWKEKGADNKALRDECADLRKRLEAAQNEKLAIVQAQLDTINKRRETDDRLASNLASLHDILKARVPV